jgi:hypothetical protein
LIRAVRAALTALALVALPGCLTVSGGSSNAIPAVRVQASTDLDCPQKDIRILQKLGGQFLAIGCARKALYSTGCDGLRCTVAPAGQIVPYHDRPDPTPTP